MNKYEQPNPPVNQIAAELDLFNSYSQQFPEALPLLKQALGLIEGIVNLDQHGRGLWQLPLKMRLSPAELNGHEPSLDDKGLLIVGDMPPETGALLDGIYGLIGAQTVRDDHAVDQQKGIVLRRGKYHGRPVYTREAYDQDQAGRKTLMVWLLDEITAASDLTEQQATAGVLGRTGQIADEPVRDGHQNAAPQKSFAYKAANFISHMGLTWHG